MLFDCEACGRRMQAQEPLYFCPFCGRRYREEPVAAHVETDSDAGRTVQEKYWHAAHAALIRLTLLLAKRPARRRTEDWADNADLLKELKHARSSEVFLKACTRRLEEIGTHLSQAQDKRAALAPDEQLKRIRDMLRRAAEIVGCAFPEEPEPCAAPAEAEKSEAVLDFDAEGLMNQAQEALPRVRQILGEEGVYPALAAAEDMLNEDWAQVDPRALERQLRVLSEEEYDPIFGMPCSRFLQAFFQAIFLLRERAGGETTMAARRREEMAADAAEKCLDEWTERLTRALDEAYARGEDMLRVSDELEKLCRAVNAEKP